MVSFLYVKVSTSWSAIGLIQSNVTLRSPEAYPYCKIWPRELFVINGALDNKHHRTSMYVSVALHFARKTIKSKHIMHFTKDIKLNYKHSIYLIRFSNIDYSSILKALFGIRNFAKIQKPSPLFTVCYILGEYYYLASRCHSRQGKKSQANWNMVFSLKRTLCSEINATFGKIVRPCLEFHQHSHVLVIYGKHLLKPWL